MPEDKFQPSSFIPKEVAHYRKPKSSGSGDSASGSNKNLLSIIGMSVAGLAALVAAAAFFYTQYLETSLIEKQEELARAQAAFEPEVISDLNEIDTRLSSATEILEAHTAVTPVFDVIESITLVSVQLTDVTIRSRSRAMTQDEIQAQNRSETPIETDGGDVVVSMIGLARDYAGVALQSQAMSENEELINPELSNFELNEQGSITFSVEFSLPESYMSYEETI